MIKNILRILKNPNTWIRNYPTNETVDKFFRMLIEHKDEVNILKKDYPYLTFEFRNHIYSVWIANQFYAYLGRISEKNANVEKRTYDPSLDINKIENVLPSRITQLDFYETFDLAFTTEDESQFLKMVLSENKKELS